MWALVNYEIPEALGIRLLEHMGLYETLTT